MTLRIEGYTPAELLELPDEDFGAFVLTGKAIIFRIGTAEILGQFAVQESHLVLELAHVDGGGEGVLPAIAALARRYARSRGLEEIEWLVYATNCERPNLRLRQVLERRGFEVRNLEGKGECYHRIELADS